MSIERERRVAIDRLEIGVLHDHELALRHLPAADDLVGPDVLLVERAPALLLDRRLALSMKKAERDVRLPGRRLRRRRQADGDADQPEADRAVPGSSHSSESLVADRVSSPSGVYSLPRRLQSCRRRSGRSDGSGETLSRLVTARRRISPSGRAAGRRCRGTTRPAASTISPTACSRSASGRETRSASSSGRESSGRSSTSRSPSSGR